MPDSVYDFADRE